MASEQLKQTLLDLHARLAAGEQLDPELQGLLQLLETDIHARLQRTDLPLTPALTGDATAHVALNPGSPSVPPATGRTDTHVNDDMGSTVEALTDPATNGLSSRAQEISARFAARHPHLEPVLRELTDTLQRIGI